MVSAWLLSEVLYLRPFFQDLTRILITVFALVSIRIWMDENTFPAFGHILLHIPRKNWVTYTCYPKANIGSDGRKSKMHVRGAHFFMNFVGRFLKALFFNSNNKTYFDFLMGQTCFFSQILACLCFTFLKSLQKNEILWNLGTPKVAFRHDLITVSCADFWHTSFGKKSLLTRGKLLHNSFW